MLVVWRDRRAVVLSDGSKSSTRGGGVFLILNLAAKNRTASSPVPNPGGGSCSGVL